MSNISTLYDSAELQAIIDRNNHQELLETVEDYLAAILVEIDGV